jgi:prepilin-type N-terminal cleavage/methylation domain-containing protein
MKTNSRRRLGFTLIELLVVIAIIAILAALLIPGIGRVRQKMALNKVQAELAKVETAIEDYKAKLGHYPQDNPVNYAVNPLFFELCGVGQGAGTYQALSVGAAIPAASVGTFYGNGNISGFVNSLRPGSEDGQTARAFIKDLKPGEYLRVRNNGVSGAVLGTTVDGPGMLSEDGGTGFINPFRYNSTNPTNNPNSFDLWVDVLVGGKTNRVNNWLKKPIVL